MNQSKAGPKGCRTHPLKGLGLSLENLDLAGGTHSSTFSSLQRHDQASDSFGIELEYSMGLLSAM